MFLENIDRFERESTLLKNEHKQNCKICNGEGITNSEMGYITCPCVKEANIKARLIANGLPKRFINLNWQNDELFQGDKIIFNKLQDFCSNIEKNMNSVNNLFIHSNDLNKIMTLEAIMANDISRRKNFENYFYNILFVTVDDLIQTAYYGKSNNETRAKLQKIINNVDILILNGLGDELDTRNDFTTKYLNNTLTSRIFDGKLNIFSSGLTLEQIINKYDSNLASIIKNNFKPVKLTSTVKDEIGSDEDNGYY